MSTLQAINLNVDASGGFAEPIVVDDGSSQTSAAALGTLLGNSRGTTLLRGAGTGAARNLGLTQARGTYVSFADDYDEVHFAVWEAAVRAQRHGSVSMNAVDVMSLAAALRTLSLGSPARQATGPDPSGSLLGDIARYPGIWRFASRRKFPADHNCRFPGLSYAEDLLFLLEISATRPTCLGLKAIAYTHVERSGGASSSLKDAGEEPTYALDRLLMLGEYSSRPQARSIARAWARRIAGRLVIEGTPSQRSATVRRASRILGLSHRKIPRMVSD